MIGSTGVGLIFGGAGSAALAAISQGCFVYYNYETRGKHYLDTFMHNLGGSNFYCNGISTVATDDFNDLNEYVKYSDIVIGQPDCKIYSKLRTRKKEIVNITDTQLFQFMEYVNYIGPKIFIVENLVDGIAAIWNYLNTYDSRLKLSGLTDHYNLKIIDLDASGFLPQRRKRSFLIGAHNQYCDDPNMIDYWENHPTWSQSSDFNCRSVLKDLEDKDSFDKFLNHKAPKHSKERIKRFAELVFGESYYGTQNNRKIDPDGLAPTITSHCTQYVHYKNPRTLTVRECARLMGWPDWFEFKGTTTQQYDQVGKAIVVPVIEDLLRWALSLIKR